MSTQDRDETLSQDRASRVKQATDIAARYEAEAERELRKPYAENFRRIAASYRRLAEELAR